MPSKPLLRYVVVAALAALFVLTSRSASAYPWMIRHEYGGCAVCHADPSGGGLLTGYGRAQSDALLSQRWGRGSTGEVSKGSAFLWNAFGDLPESVLLGAHLRTLFGTTKLGTAPAQGVGSLMQADLVGQIAVGRVRASGSVGGAPDGGAGAAVTRGDEGHLVSREHWVGVDLGAERDWLVRAGRIALPFGLRSIDHRSWVRVATRTNVNDEQSHGAAVAYTGESFRFEAMAYLGNLQIAPSEYRERGYSALAEFFVGKRAGVGVSSLVGHSARDIDLRVAETRQAHGVFARYSPWKPLVLSGELDATFASVEGLSMAKGHASIVQLDAEVVQGVHAMLTGESLSRGFPNEGSSYGGFASVWWFPTSHVDVRVDAAAHHLAVGTSSLAEKSLYVLGHVYF